MDAFVHLKCHPYPRNQPKIPGQKKTYPVRHSGALRQQKSARNRSHTTTMAGSFGILPTLRRPHHYRLQDHPRHSIRPSRFHLVQAQLLHQNMEGVRLRLLIGTRQPRNQPRSQLFISRHPPTSSADRATKEKALEESLD